MRIAAGVLVSIAILASLAPVAFGQVTVIEAGSPVMVTLGSWRFLNVTLHNEISAAMDLVVFAVWKNSIGQTVSVNTGAITISGGGVSNCYVPIFDVLAGSYTVFLFAVTTTNNPVSLSLSVPIFILGS